MLELQECPTANVHAVAVCPNSARGVDLPRIYLFWLKSTVETTVGPRHKENMTRPATMDSR